MEKLQNVGTKSAFTPKKYCDSELEFQNTRDKMMHKFNSMLRIANTIIFKSQGDDSLKSVF